MRVGRKALSGAGVARCVGVATLTGLAVLAPGGIEAGASMGQWSIFEDHRYLVRSGAATREQTLNEMRALGADTLRVQLKWAEVAPDPGSATRPAFDARNPSAYPGFGPYDDVVRRAAAKGFRILLTLTGDAPRWATAGGRGGNYKPRASEFARFAEAVGARYSGAFSGVPRVGYFSIWNEPNHTSFLRPRSQMPRLYRRLVAAGMPALRAQVAPDVKVFVGELAPVANARSAIGPLSFLRRWLCLNRRFKRLRGRAARRAGCNGFTKVTADGFAHHPYGPVGLRPGRRKDIVNMLVIRRLGSALDRAARAGRIPRRLRIYSTEFGVQTDPPDPFVSTSPAQQAKEINEKEAFSYRYWRLKSYSQYLLRDDPARPGPAVVRWSGFQTGLRFAGGTAKVSYDAYRFPIAVRGRRGSRRVKVWGRVRPAGVRRYVQIQRRSRGRFRRSGRRIRTNRFGYFSARRNRGRYRFAAYVDNGSGPKRIGTSRTAGAPH